VTWSGPLTDRLDDTWKHALVGGLASIPLTTAGYWQSGSELSLSPVFLGGVLAGYLASRETGSARGVGIRAGLVGGLPSLWIVADVFGAASGLAGPPWFVTAGLILTVAFVAGFVLLALGFSAFVGEIGARVGDWAAGRTGQCGPPATSG
jgi:hypothetical protein